MKKLSIFFLFISIGISHVLSVRPSLFQRFRSNQTTPSSSTATRIPGLTRDPTQIQFYIVREKWEDRSELHLNDSGVVLEGSGFRGGGGRQTFILIDGFDSPRTPFYQLITSAIRNTSSTSSSNIIVVDYRALSGRETTLQSNPLTTLILYLSVLKNADIVGAAVASFIHHLQKEVSLNLRGVHVIGMSLGCHVAGSAGIALAELNYNDNSPSNPTGLAKLGRITGLDPARTAFPLRNVKRLRSQDDTAEFVDVYHTNRGTLGEIYEGTVDLNVYINGGALQPGCGSEDFRLFPYPGLCSHLFVWEWFASTFSRDFYACPCSGWDCYCQQNCPVCSPPQNYSSSKRGRGRNGNKGIKVGIHVSKSDRGSYHTSVTDPAPGKYFKEIKTIFKPSHNRQLLRPTTT